RRRTFEDLVNKSGGSMIQVKIARPVADQPSVVRIFPGAINRRQSVLGSKLSDQSEIRLRESVNGHDERVGTLLGSRIEGWGQILEASHVEKLGIDAERSRRPLHLFPLNWDDRVPHIEQARDSCSSRKQFFE